MFVQISFPAELGLLLFVHTIGLSLERTATRKREVVSGHGQVEAGLADDLLEHATLLERAARGQPEPAYRAAWRG